MTPITGTAQGKSTARACEKVASDLGSGVGGWVGHALMAKWSKVLPLIASCFLLLPGFKFQLGRVRNLPVTWE